MLVLRRMWGYNVHRKGKAHYFALAHRRPKKGRGKDGIRICICSRDGRHIVRPGRCPGAAPAVLPPTGKAYPGTDGVFGGFRQQFPSDCRQPGGQDRRNDF